MDLAAFLDAKYALDERSVCAPLRDAFLRELRSMASVECLDVGAGTGASLRRMTAWRPDRPWRMTLLERDPALIERARCRAAALLEENGLRPSVADDEILAGGGRIAVRFAACELDSYRPSTRFDVVIAHAILDLVPLAPALTRLASWLRPGGVLYAAIHYDGETRFEPPYPDAAFERDVLACYDASMEARRVGGQATGGALCGRRLEALLPAHGFAIVAAGCSDWRIRPSQGAYPDEDAVCLRKLVEFVHGEAVGCGRFEPAHIAQWRRLRLQQIEAGVLGLRVRNRDVLARATPSYCPMAGSRYSR